MSKYAGVNKRERDIDKALRKLEGSKRTQEKISKLKKAYFYARLLRLNKKTT